jgi:hypothetical protein
MKILIPVPVEKRLPEIKEGELFSATVLVHYTNPKVDPKWNALHFAYCDASGRWEDAMPCEKMKIFGNDSNKVIEWFEEREAESLFPDADKSYLIAKNATNDSIPGIAIHQEGQNFNKNYFLRELKK